MYSYSKRLLSYLFNANDVNNENISSRKETQLSSHSTFCVKDAFFGKIYKEMRLKFPQQFNFITPFTSRPPLNDEIAGKDFHYVSKERIREDAANNRCIELFEKNNMLSSMTIGGVQHVIQSNQHCILDVIYAQSILCLKSANIHPIVILVRPSSSAQIIEWSGGQMSGEEAEKEFKRVQRDENMFAGLFTHVISEARSFEDIFQQVLDIIIGQHNQSEIGQSRMKECAIWIDENDREISTKSTISLLSCTLPCPMLSPDKELRYQSWVGQDVRFFTYPDGRLVVVEIF